MSIGFAFAALSDRGICGLYMLDDADPTPGLDRLRSDFPGAELVEACEEVEPVLQRIAAFLDDGRDLDDLVLDLHGTPFQLRVWNALRSIGAGSTCTYGQIARKLGLGSAAARAVGAACGANPVSLIVPCHRVVGSNGKLCGYRWGLARKRALLERERKHAQQLIFAV